MLSLTDLLWVAIAGFALNYWWRSRHFRDYALKLAARRCEELELQLLDQSVVLRGMELKRDDEDRLVLRRRYQFEFTSTGQERYLGWVILRGWRLEEIDMEPHLL